MENEMGLDMYLSGEKFFWTNWEDRSKDRKEDGMKVQSLQVELGYWRKHPNLHGYIVNTFAGGKDECQSIELYEDDLLKIIDAVKGKDLPHTEGFFFGKSSDDQDQITKDVKILEGAISWVKIKELGVSRSVVYQASW